ncbi:MAG: hypothetical protein QOH67_3376 [Hyphomicrobiales bacterium]|nr:hypothetical protein [Hyphomicrobiales bacterium]
MRVSWTRQAAAVAVLLGLASAAGAQPPPPAPAPPVAAPKPAAMTSVDGGGCNTVERPVSAGGASMVPEQPGQQKNWQPPGGEITFTIRSFTQIPSDALVLVCFRWKRTGERQDRYTTARPTHLDLTDAGRLLKITVVVPLNLPKAPPRFSGDGEFAGLYLVPLADVRILVLGKNLDGSLLVAADVSHLIGVSNPFWAVLIALSTVLAAFAVLSVIGHRRLKRFGYGDLDPVIRLITTPDGYASLSQLQLVLWTFVVAASAVYVMVLSGELIEVTSGTLVLLGISGAVSVGTKLHDNAQAPNPTGASEPRKPRWSDLIVNDVNGKREMDITRVQMLYFTLVTASFVVMRVLTTYVIPEIPQGFQILMGISNAVYFGSKVAQPVANVATAPDAANTNTSTPPAQSS